MRIFLLSILTVVCLVSKSQINIWRSSRPVSKFIKDGRVFISYDSKKADVQTFWPLDSIYTCKGNNFEPITDTALVNGVWTIKMGTRTVKVLEEIYSLKAHIMFNLMYACIDDKYIYCQCGTIFKLKK